MNESDELEVKKWEDVKKLVLENSKSDIAGFREKSVIVLGRDTYKLLGENFDFSFKQLVKDLKKKPNFKCLFDILDTEDLREVLHELVDSLKIYRALVNDSSNSKEEIAEEQEFLKKVKECLDELGDAIRFEKLDYGSIRKALENKALGKEEKELRGVHKKILDLFKFTRDFKYIFSLNYAWILYWMYMIDAQNEFGDMFGSKKNKDKNKTITWFSSKSDNYKESNVEAALERKNVLIYPYGGMLLFKENRTRRVGKATAINKEKDKNSEKEKPENFPILEIVKKILSGGDSYPLLYSKDFLREQDEQNKHHLIEDNEYFEFIYKELIPKVIKKQEPKLLVLYQLIDFDSRSYLLNSLLEVMPEESIVAVGVAAESGKQWSNNIAPLYVNYKEKGIKIIPFNYESILRNENAIE